MIKKLVVVFILLMLPVLSAVEFDINDNYKQGETLLAKVSGNFLDQIRYDNIKFYREHVRVPMEYNVVQINEEFYIYALLGNKEQNNYSIRIEGVRYMQGTQIINEDIIKNFTITNETADFSVNPGFIITDREFYIEVQNLQSYKINVELIENYSNQATEEEGFFDSLFGDSESQSETGMEVKSGEIKKFYFELGNKTSFRFVQLKTNSLSYSIPVYAFVNPTSIQSEQQNFTDEDEINDTSENQTVGDEFNIIVGSNETNIKKASTKTCEEEGGFICSSSEETCEGDSTLTSNGVCCLSVCSPVEKSSSGKIFGWAMISIILIVLILFFRSKSKHKRKKIDFLKASRPRR